MVLRTWPCIYVILSRSCRCVLVAVLSCFVLQVIYHSNRGPKYVVSRFFPEDMPSDGYLNVIHSFFDMSCLRVHPANQSQHPFPPWQRHTEGETEIHIRSAFYDNRTVAGVNPWLRLLAVASNFQQGYCQVWYPGNGVAYTTKIIVHRTGRGAFYRRFYAQIQMSCMIPRGPIPSHVSVSVKPCSQSQIYMPVHVPKHDTQDFGICVAIAFGQLDNDQVIEWAELSRKLGVSKIHIYNATIDRQHDALFRYYEQQDFMAVHQMPPPVPFYTRVGAKLGSPASLNDCMLRYMYTYRYIIVVDFDEVIVPREDTDYQGLLHAIDAREPKTSNWQGYTFRNVYFFTDLSADQTQANHLLTLRHRTKARPQPFHEIVKSFVDPRRCLSVFNHYCYIRFPKSPEPFSVDVPTDLAASHHYRYQCPPRRKDCKTLLSTLQTDDVMLRYKDYLLKKTAIVRSALETMTS